MSRVTASKASPRGVYVARQPILDQNRRIFGYELLYRGSLDAETAEGASGDYATAHLICDGLEAIGLDTLTDGRKAFINISRRLLVSGIPELLPANRVVFELGADVEADSEVLEACAGLREAGYELAIDDFAMTEWLADLMPLASFVKVDFAAQQRGERPPVRRADLPGGPILVGKHIETLAHFDEAVGDGYDYLQGFFFGRPVVREGRTLPAQQFAQIRLMRALNDPNLSVMTLEELVKPDPTLCYRILRTVNSASFALHKEVSSIRDALVLLGRDTIRRWASLWILAGLNQGAHSELLAMAAIRARSCELLGAATGDDDAAADGFLLGMCSLLDAILERPMAELVEELPLPAAVKGALLGEVNDRRRMLDCVSAYAGGQFDEASSLVRELGIAPTVLARAYNESLKWARDLQRADAA